MANIVLKAKRATDKEFAHTDVYVDGSCIGYIIKNNSTLRVKGENWNFCSYNSHYVFFYGKTKQEVIDTLTSMANKLEE